MDNYYSPSTTVPNRPTRIGERYPVPHDGGWTPSNPWWIPNQYPVYPYPAPCPGCGRCPYCGRRETFWKPYFYEGTFCKQQN